MSGDRKRDLEMAVEQQVTQSMQARQRLVHELERFDQRMREAIEHPGRADDDDDRTVEGGWRLPWRR